MPVEIFFKGHFNARIGLIHVYSDIFLVQETECLEIRWLFSSRGVSTLEKLFARNFFDPKSNCTLCTQYFNGLSASKFSWIVFQSFSKRILFVEQFSKRRQELQSTLINSASILSSCVPTVRHDKDVSGTTDWSHRSAGEFNNATHIRTYKRNGSVVFLAPVHAKYRSEPAIFFSGWLFQVTVNQDAPDGFHLGSWIVFRYVHQYLRVPAADFTFLPILFQISGGPTLNRTKKGTPSGGGGDENNVGYSWKWSKRR